MPFGTVGMRILGVGYGQGHNTDEYFDIVVFNAVLHHAAKHPRVA